MLGAHNQFIKSALALSMVFILELLEWTLYQATLCLGFSICNSACG